MLVSIQQNEKSICKKCSSKLLFCIMKENLISKAIAIVGLCNLAKACGVKHQSVYRWVEKGSLPRTDWTGETDYARRIEEATKGAVTRDELLNFKRSEEPGGAKPHRDTEACHA